MFVDNFTTGCAAIVRQYIADTSNNDQQAKPRAQQRLDNLRAIYHKALSVWDKGGSGPIYDCTPMLPERTDAARTVADDLTLEEFREICIRNRDSRNTCAALAVVATQRGPEFGKVYEDSCPSVAQREAAFAALCELVQDVLDTDTQLLPSLYQLTEASTAQLDHYVPALPGSSVWDTAAQAAQNVMGHAGVEFGIEI